jgi:hypothetical protein
MNIFYSINLITGCAIGVEYEKVETDEYLIISLLIIQIIFTW